MAKNLIIKKTKIVSHFEFVKKAIDNHIENKLADKIIKEMQDDGLTPDQMLKVIKLAREKFKLLSDGTKNTLHTR